MSGEIAKKVKLKKSRKVKKCDKRRHLKLIFPQEVFGSRWIEIPQYRELLFRRVRRDWRVTLSNKCLAGVQENLAAFYDHPLYCQVLPDVLCFAHLIVHDSEGKKKKLNPPHFL